MGSGHIMRCLTLASAARQAGAIVVMGGHCTIPWLCPRLEEEGYLFWEEPCPPQADVSCLLAQLEDMARRIHCPTRDCAVILDGYHFTPLSQSAARKQARVLLVIDDYHHLPRYDCDILLNQNPGSEVYSYQGSVGLKLLALNTRCSALNLKPPLHQGVGQKAFFSVWEEEIFPVSCPAWPLSSTSPPCGIKYCAALREARRKK